MHSHYDQNDNIIVVGVGGDYFNRLLTPLAMEKLAAEAERMGDMSPRQVALTECLERLPPAQRELLSQCYAGQSSIQDAAQGIGRTFNAVRQSLFRIRRALYRCVEQRLADSSAT